MPLRVRALLRRRERRLHCAALFVIVVLAALPSAAPGQQVPFLVKDINTATESSNPYFLTKVNGTVYFGACPPETGCELWKTDGTGATLVVDLIEGPSGSDPDRFTAVGDTLFFRGCDLAHGCELWKSENGGPGELVADLNPGRYGSDPDALTNFGGTLFFTAYDPTDGWGLRKTDGVTTTRVVGAAPYWEDEDARNVVAVGSTLFFRQCDLEHGCELWKYDGTATTLVADIAPGPENSNLEALTAVNDTLFFMACEPTYGCEPWTSDGVTTTLVADIEPGVGASFPHWFTAVGDTVFFVACDTAHGCEPWKSDGITASLVADVVPGSESSNPAGLTNVAGTLFFAVCDDATNTCELWKSDGNTATLVGEVPVRPNPGGYIFWSFVYTFRAVGDELFFTGCDATNGCEIWKSDGVTVALFADVVPGAGSSDPGGYVDVDGTIFFTANDRSAGREVLKTDGITTTVVADLNTTVGGSSPTWLTDGGDVLFLLAADPVAGNQVWKSDGTELGTIRVDNEFARRDMFTPCELKMAGKTLFFIDYSQTVPDGRELWKSDGIDTSFVTDLGRGGFCFTTSSNQMAALGDFLFFRKCVPTGPFSQRCALWKTDGVTTALVADVPPSNPTVVGSALYFEVGDRLWKTDGTTAAPVDTDAVYYFDRLIGVGNTLFFTGMGIDPETGLELWKTDGVTTSLVEDIVPGIVGSSPAQLTAVGGSLFFVACDLTHGCELWHSDGSSATLVADIEPGPFGSYPTQLTAVGGSLFFVACDSTYGCELWHSDGSSATLVADLAPGSASPPISQLTDVGGTLYFDTCTDAYGCELWKSDGVTASLAADIVPGEVGSGPYRLTYSGGTLFFAADDGIHGTELWALVGTCGNGAPDPGEECDDGNHATGDGCDASCRLESGPEATPTPGVTPVPTATATPTATPGCPSVPVTGCRPPDVGTRGSLVLKDEVPDRRDRLHWKWQGRASAAPEDFGDPTARGGTGYQLCVYDGAPSLILDAAIPAGGTCGTAKPKPCWRKTARGYVYADKHATRDGIQRIDLEQRARSGRAYAIVTGKGERLDDPTFPLAQPVTVQLHRTDRSTCWEAVYSAPAANNAAGRSRDFADTAD